MRINRLRWYHTWNIFDRLNIKKFWGSWQTSFLKSPAVVLWQDKDLRSFAIWTSFEFGPLISLSELSSMPLDFSLLLFVRVSLFESRVIALLFPSSTDFSFSSKPDTTLKWALAGEYKDVFVSQEFASGGSPIRDVKSISTKKNS